MPNQMRNILPLFFHIFVYHCTAISLFSNGLNNDLNLQSEEYTMGNLVSIAQLKE